MRAITVSEPGGPEALQLTEVETPSPRPGEVLIRTSASGVNRADLLQRRGLYPPPKGISDIIGLECSGVVSEIGDGVSEWHVGDECVALLAGGGYAEYVVVPAGQLVAPPAGVDLITSATLIEVAATVVSNMDHVHLRPGETLLVHGGTGGIGQFAIQYAKALGCRVLTTAGTEDKLDRCRELGADHAINYHDDWEQAVKEATGGDGADVILDIMGAKYLEPNVRSLAADGRLVIIGMQGGTKATLNIAGLLSKRGTVTATSLRHRPVDQKSEICASVVEKVWPMLADGRITPAPVQQFALADANQAHQRLESGDSMGKLCLVVGQSD